MVPILILSNACWSDRDPCEHWTGKLARGQETSAALEQIRGLKCVGARPVLLEHLGDEGLSRDVLTALVALDRSPEAETAVRRALGRRDTVDAAAAQVVAWKLTSAEPELRAALGDAALADHHAELLAAALAVAPPAAFLDAILARLDVTGTASREAVLKALAGLDAQALDAAARGRVVEALAELATRPSGVSADDAAAARAHLTRFAIDPAPPMSAVVERARAGDRDALLLLAAVAHPDTAAITRALAVRADVAAEARWLAVALLAAARDPDSAALVAGAPPDAEVLFDVTLLAQAAAREALVARRESDKGAGRAATAHAEVLTLDAAALDPWLQALSKEASMLLRGLPEAPDVLAVVALTRRCGQDAACLTTVLQEGRSRLESFDVESSALGQRLKDSRAQTEAKTAQDTARARELAQATGADVAAAKAELDAIAARTKDAWAPVLAMEGELDRLRALELTQVVALRRLVGAPDSAAPARAVLDACVGAACTRLRTWAVAVVLAAEAPTGAARLDLLLRVKGP